MPDFVVDFNALNNSGVNGFAVLSLDEENNTLSVWMAGEGLEPDQPHAQHIHGSTDGAESERPTIAQDADTDGFVEFAEGEEAYGPILLNLTSPPTDAGQTDDGAPDDTADGTGDPDAGAADTGDGTADGTTPPDASATTTDAQTFAGTADPNAFPTAAGGTLQFNETYTFDLEDEDEAALLESLTPLENREIVLHGMTVPEGAGDGTGGEVDGTGGFKPELPVASGLIRPIDAESAAVASVLIGRLEEDAFTANDLALIAALASDDGTTDGTAAA